MTSSGGRRVRGGAWRAAALLPLAWTLGAVAAEAQSALTVRTLEHRDWGDAVSALQHDRGAQGRVLHVVVEDAQGVRAPCGRYQLMVDDAGGRAFALGECDPRSSATALTLVDRRALFDTSSALARPLQIGIGAVEQRSGAALGGATLEGESELRCSIAVRPFVRDLLSGEVVRATPERFALQLEGDGARVDTTGDAWRVTSGSVSIRYALVDRATGDVVARETVRMSCARDAPSGAAASPITGGAEVIPLVPDRVFRGATITRQRVDDHGSCGGHEGPEQWYVVRLTEPRRLSLRLVSEFDATLYIRADSIHGREIACLDRAARLETFEMNLEPGTYYVAVDGTGTHGRYRLVSYEEPLDPRARLDDTPSILVPREDQRSTLVPMRSRHAASCGGAQAPEHVYAFEVRQPSFVSVRLQSRFDSALYLLARDGQEVCCRRVLGYPRATRENRVRAELPAGLYYVVVDGESGAASTGSYRLALSQLPLP